MRPGQSRFSSDQPPALLPGSRRRTGGSAVHPCPTPRTPGRERLNVGLRRRPRPPAEAAGRSGRPSGSGWRRSAGEAAERGEALEVLLDLGDGGAAAQAGEAADELHVGEVARGQRVGVAAAVEAEALHGPGADLADRERRSSSVGRERGRPARRRPRGRSGSSRSRAPEQVHAGKLGRGAAGDRLRRRHVAEPARRSGSGAWTSRPQRRTIRRSIAAARGGLDQLPGDRPRERLPGPGAPPRAHPGPPPQRRARAPGRA